MLKKLGTEHFKVSLFDPIIPGGESRVCVSEAGPDSNSIFFTKVDLPELISLLNMAEQYFNE